MTVGIKGEYSIKNFEKLSNVRTGFDNDIALFNNDVLPNGSGGVFARVDKGKNVFSVELNHSWQTVKAVMIGPNELGFPEYDLMFVNPRLGYSYKPLPWLRLNAGLGANLYYEPKFQVNQRLKNELNRAEYFATSLKQYENDNSANGQQMKQMLLGQQKVEAISNSYFKAIRKVYFDARLGVGVDFGGFMIDLNYNRTLTPIIQDIDYNGQASPLNLQYDYLSLSVGYRILPIRKFLLPPRKNKTYEKIQSEIPFYKNEVNFLFGKQSENKNSLNIYESSYTRYLLKRVGVTIGINTIQSPLSATDNDGLPNIGIQNAITVFSEAKFLPLYTKKHRIGLAAGINYIRYEGLEGTTYLITSDNIPAIYQPIFQPIFQPLLIPKKSSFGYQFTVDYNYLLTKRIPIGGWLRANSNKMNRYGDFIALGIKTGYLF
ncbi:hypothetical protein GCM10011514_47090 [Emticicia aquatilis]|uniref:Uncharacterized protein n=1 Tax=Emticicia aquatilis TaxID=1537369 RepID=A0A916Z6J3_9BACT|nr:hypothetical protein GCM10011514_47090 [Emticicia aquatilis]